MNYSESDLKTRFCLKVVKITSVRWQKQEKRQIGAAFHRANFKICLISNPNNINSPPEGSAIQVALGRYQALPEVRYGNGRWQAATWAKSISIPLAGMETKWYEDGR